MSRGREVLIVEVVTDVNRKRVAFSESVFVKGIAFVFISRRIAQIVAIVYGVIFDRHGENTLCDVQGTCSQCDVIVC